MKKDNEKNLLVLLSKYKETDNKTAIIYLLNTFIPYFFFWYLAYISFDYSYILTLFFCTINAFLCGRMFSALHDCGHGTFLKNKLARNTVGFICGVFTITPYKSWSKIHAVHHSCSSNLDKRDKGDFPLITVDEFKKASKLKKTTYLFMRSPVFLLGIIPFLLFFILQRMPVQKVFNPNKYDQIDVMVNTLCMVLITIGMGNIIGYEKFLLIQFPINLMAATLGVWNFFFQHQYENTYWSKNEDFSYIEAGLKGSAYLKVNPVLQWCLGYTGYHHIHHLLPAIPCYNLEKCFFENKEFQKEADVNVISSFKSFSLNLWDENKKVLVSHKNI
jgi:omega-6 fatty acid desaturase (delta-12 desaturase)